MTAPARLRNFIGGEWRASGSDRWIADVHPSNAREILAHVPAGTDDDVDPAVRSAYTEIKTVQLNA